MFRTTTTTSGHSYRHWAWMPALFALAFLLLAMPLQAAPPAGKGGGGGKGGGDGGGFVPEQHHLWRVQLPGPYSMVRPAVAPDGTIYAVDVFDNLVAVAPNGAPKWYFTNAGSKGVAVGPDGTIYTGNELWINAINPDGSLKWTFWQNPLAFILQDVAVGPDGNIYAIATNGMGVFSLRDNGDHAVERWRTPEIYARDFVGYTELAFGPTADGMDDQLYFFANGHTRGIKLSNGESVFTVGEGNTRPKVSEFDGTWHRPATAYDPNANLVWAFDFPVATGTSEPSLAFDGTHYAVNAATELYAIDPFGFLDWRVLLDENVGLTDVDPTESLVIMDTFGTATHPAALKAVSASNGSPLWRMEFPPDETGLPTPFQYVDSGIEYSANGDTAYVMTVIMGWATDAEGNFVAYQSNAYLNAVATDPALPTASTQLRSTDVSLSARSSRKGVSVTGIVTVMDENRGLVSGATVSAVWKTPDKSAISQTATTGGSGTAKFSVTGSSRGGYSLKVVDIVKDGYPPFDAQHSVLQGAIFE